MAKENRKYPRYPFIATAIVRIENVDVPKQISTLANNISLNGVGLNTYKPLDKGVPASIELAFVSRKGTKVKDTVDGRVAWMAQQGDFFTIGVAFNEELNPAKQPNLYSHFNNVVKW